MKKSAERKQILPKNDDLAEHWEGKRCKILAKTDNLLAEQVGLHWALRFYFGWWLCLLAEHGHGNGYDFCSDLQSVGRRQKRNTENISEEVWAEFGTENKMLLIHSCGEGTEYCLVKQAIVNCKFNIWQNT